MQQQRRRIVRASPIIGRPATPLPPAQRVPHRRRRRELFAATIPCRVAAFTLKGNDRGRTRTDPTDARRDPDFRLRLRADRLRRLPGSAVADRAEPGAVQPDRPALRRQWRHRFRAAEAAAGYALWPVLLYLYRRR